MLGILRSFRSFVDHDVPSIRRGVGSYAESGSNSRKQSNSYQRLHRTIICIAAISASGNSGQGGPKRGCGSDCGAFPCAIAQPILRRKCNGLNVCSRNHCPTGRAQEFQVRWRQASQLSLNSLISTREGGSRRPGVVTESGVPNHLESFGSLVLIAGEPSHHSEALCWSGTS